MKATRNAMANVDTEGNAAVQPGVSYRARDEAEALAAKAERGVINAEVTGRLTESIGGVRVVKGYHAEAREHSIFAAGVQRLLSIAEVVQRMRPLMSEEPLSPRESRRLAQEMGELMRILGLD